MSFFAQTLRAEMVDLGRRRKPDPATKAARGREKFYLGETGWAGAIGGGRIRRKAAEGTLGWKKEIQNRSPERSGAHILAGK
jgi:hypothetical protein